MNFYGKKEYDNYELLNKKHPFVLNGIRSVKTNESFKNDVEDTHIVHLLMIIFYVYVLMIQDISDVI